MSILLTVLSAVAGVGFGVSVLVVFWLVARTKGYEAGRADVWKRLDASLNRVWQAKVRGEPRAIVEFPGVVRIYNDVRETSDLRRLNTSALDESLKSGQGNGGPLA